jgi:hypothetical protein
VTCTLPQRNVLASSHLLCWMSFANAAFSGSFLKKKLLAGT